MDNIVPGSMNAPINNIYGYIEEMARKNVSGNLTGPERISAVAFEKLRLAQELRIGTDLMVGLIFETIEDRDLWRAHPEGYSSPEEGYKLAGYSTSEISDIRAMSRTIVPFMRKMEKELSDFNAMETMLSVGKSNMRQLVPPLTVIITGEPSKQKKVNEYVNRVVDSVNALAKESGIKLTSDEERMYAARQMFEVGKATSNDLRTEMRGETPTIEGVMVGKEKKFLILELDDEEDFLTLDKIEGKYLTVNRVEKGAPLTAVPMFRAMLEANV